MQAKWTAAPYSLTLDELLAQDPQHSFLHNDIIYVGTDTVGNHPRGPLSRCRTPWGSHASQAPRVHHGHACCSSSSTKLPLAHPRAASRALRSLALATGSRALDSVVGARHGLQLAYFSPKGGTFDD